VISPRCETARRLTVTDPRLAEADRALRRGWALTPLQGKRPTRSGWTTEAPLDRDAVLSWAQSGNVGLRTGRPSGVVVLDDDSDCGSASNALGLPLTPTVKTGGGGRHLYFRCPNGGLGNSASRLAQGIDVRGDGGVVALPGSVHPETGQPYEWVAGCSPEDLPLADLPAKILERLRPAPRVGDDGPRPATTMAHAEDRLGRYAEGALKRAADTVAAASEGTRNDELNRQAFGLGRFVGIGLLDRAHVEEELGKAAAFAGLEQREIAATLRSGLDSGAADPHDLQELRERVGHRAAGDTEPTKQSAAPQDPVGRPVIILEGGKLPEIVDQAEAALLASEGDAIYQRGGLLVRMVRTEATGNGDAIRRGSGALLLQPVEPAYLVDRLTRAAAFFRHDARSGDLRAVDCPERVAKTLVARAGGWQAPLLHGIVEAPTLRHDGTILDTPGYDAESKIFFDPGATGFVPIPREPGLDGAELALDALLYLIEGFPFVTAADRAVALAAILTAVVRRSIRTAPLTAFSSPKMASGKSLLADCVAMIATGRVAAAMSQGHNEPEDRKRMLALLMEGDAVACIDNVERPLGGSALCSVLTQDVWRDRVLGASRTASVPTAMTWLATGNNIVFCGDITTRVVVCQLDPQCERPEEREFELNLRKFIPEHRGEIVAAALTILRAYVVAGSPNQGLRPFGRFEEWSDLVRSALVWVGEADPCETRLRIEEVDPVRRQLRAVLQAWLEALGERVVSANEAIAEAGAGTNGQGSLLFEALWEVAAGKAAAIDGRRLGNWLSRHERRIEDGLQVERAGERSGVVLWRVCRG